MHYARRATPEMEFVAVHERCEVETVRREVAAGRAISPADINHPESEPMVIGRLVAAALMLTGIALLGVITAALASWFVERLAEVQAADERTEAELADLVQEVRSLRAELTAHREKVGQAVR